MAANAVHGLNDLAEFRARLSELRASLGPPPQPGEFQAHTDGACLGNPDGPGGWAALVEGEGGREWELQGHLSSTTNNRAEALGVLAAVEWLPPGSTLRLRSDSELTVKVLTGAYKARANLEIVSEIRRAVADKRLTLEPEWVRGHAGDVGNERADWLSRLGATNGDVARAQQLGATRELRVASAPDELRGLVPQGSWENDFVASVRRQLSSGKQLSERQRAVLNKIRARTSR